MSCLIAAPRADGAEIVTIEGIGSGNTMSAVQSSFVDEGAVQCGYCTPGFIMAAEKLLEETQIPVWMISKWGLAETCVDARDITRSSER